MAVAHRRVRYQHPLFVAHPVGKALRPQPVEQLLGSIRRRRIDVGNHRLCRICRWLDAALGFRMPVHRHICKIGEQLRSAVLTLDLCKQLRRRIDEAGRIGVVAETRMANDGLEEGEVGRNTANSEFAQRAVHAADRFIRLRRPGRYLHQKRIVITGDDRPRIGRPAIQTNAEAGRRAVRRYTAVVGNEIVLRVFCGDTALQRMAVEADILLFRHTRFRRADGGPFQNMDLRLDDIDAGHDFGDGMLHLNARIDLDEVEFAGIDIHQIFDRLRRRYNWSQPRSSRNRRPVPDAALR